MYYQQSPPGLNDILLWKYVQSTFSLNLKLKISQPQNVKIKSQQSVKFYQVPTHVPKHLQAAKLMLTAEDTNTRR